MNCFSERSCFKAIVERGRRERERERDRDREREREIRERSDML